MNLNKTLKYIINTGIFLVPFIPLVVTGSLFFPFISGKNFLFRIIVEIIFGAWAILAIKNREYRPKHSWLLWSVFAFVGIIGVADLFGANVMKSFWSNFERMEGWITLIHLLGYFLVVGTVLNTQKLWTKFFNTVIGVSMIVGGYGILQLLNVLPINQGGVRLDATFGNATYLAIYMVFNIFLAMMFLVRRLNDRYKKGEKIFSFNWIDLFYSFAILVQFFILYHTATRGAILGLIGGMIVAFVLFIIFDEKGGILRKISLYKLAVLLILIFGFFAVKNTDMIKSSPVLSRIASISINEATSARFPVWNMALKGFKEKPILGWGQENFNYVFNKNYEPKMYNQEQWFDRAHNIFMDWLIAGGLLGLLSYLSMFFVAIYFLWRKNEFKIETKKNKFGDDFVLSDKVLLTGLFSAYLFNNIFVFDNIMSYILFFSLLGYIHTFSACEKKENDKPINIHNDWMKGVGATFVLILTLFSIYFFNVRGMMVGANMINALKEASKPESSIGFFEKALNYGYLGRPEVREQLIQTTASYATANIDLNLKQKFFDLASGEMTKQIQEDPENTRYEVFLGVFFNRYRVYDNAITHLERALVLSP
ncbi:MAG: O-antigen ligase family protein, partial [Patescibacteria group bacterium]